MIILFPKRKGVKIATTLIFKQIHKNASIPYVMGAIDFAKSFGAITEAEAQALTEHLLEEVKEG
jgi:hypothetical protein